MDLEHALDPAAESALAWALREAVTNLLRHSHATACSIAVGVRDDVAHLTVTNDGVGSTAEHGQGLIGLTERVHTLSGSLTAAPTGDGRFRLSVELPRADR